MRSTTDATRDYLDQIGWVPLLDAAEERALAERIRRGHQAHDRIDAGEDGAALRRAVREAERAKEQFIRANLRLVVSVAKRYPVSSGMEMLDLIQDDLVADDLAGPETTVVDRLQDDLVVELLEALDPRPRRAIELRVGLAGGRSRSYQEVGQDLGVSAEAARRMVQRALAVLRDAAAAFGVAA